MGRIITGLKIMELRFCPSETTFDYFQSTKRYLQTYGKPVAFYSDKHTIFRVNKADPNYGTGMTQFGRAEVRPVKVLDLATSMITI